MSAVLLRVGGTTCALEAAEARILATTLLSRPGEARADLAWRLRELVREREGSPAEVPGEEEENALRLGLAEVERDGYLTPSLAALRRVLRGTAPSRA